MGWNLQKINAGGQTQGPPAVDDPFVSVFSSQQHFSYRDSAGNIWDSYYDPGPNNWTLQRINGGAGGTTGGPAAVLGPFMGVYTDQQHFAYLDHTGAIWDSWYRQGWNLQKINLGGMTSGPAAATGPEGFAGMSIWVDHTGTQQHFTYLGADGAIYDPFWDSGTNSWHLQKINDGGNTTGPAAASAPFGCIYGASGGQQQHIGYRDVIGQIWDSWYDGVSRWNLQKINFGGVTNGPEAFIFQHPFIWLDYTYSQQHFTYLGNDLAIYDAFWDGNSWHLQKINSGGNTNGPAARSQPFACIFHSQQHIGYRDDVGNFWDSYYDGSGHWNIQKINNGGLTAGPAAVGNPFVWEWPFPVRREASNQQHFTYRDANGTIWDPFWVD